MLSFRQEMLDCIAFNAIHAGNPWLYYCACVFQHTWLLSILAGDRACSLPTDDSNVIFL